MKKYLLFTGVLLSLLNVNLVASSTLESEYTGSEVKPSASSVVVFEDPLLETSVANELGLSVGSITSSDMLTLTSLRTSGDITSLSGLEYATNLEDLHLMSGAPELTDLSPIENLTSLTTIYIDSSLGLSDISPLAGLTNLEYLSISSTNVSDLSALAGLEKLSTLHLEYNSIRDITPLSNLTGISDLSLEGNRIVDISPISGYENLTRLDISGNKVQDVSVISNFNDTLEDLDLADNCITDMSPVSNLNVITNIYMTSQLITLPKIKVYVPTEITYSVTDIDGSELLIPLGSVKPGINVLSAEFYGTADLIGHTYTGGVVQVVNYIETNLVATDEISINEGLQYSDQELVKLFEAENSEGLKVNVDQSLVDYKTPGTYEITFSDEAENIKKSNLVVKDVKPTLSLDKNAISIKKNSNIDDVTSQLNIVATELSKGDLNSKVILDDSEINYKKVGEYKLQVSVTDDEGNTVVKYVTVSIVDDKVNINLIVEDDEGSGTIDFYQYDSQGNPLSGFEYGIYDEDGNLVDTVITDENGHAVSDELPKGKYYVKLINVPAGYELDDNVYEMTVGSKVSSVVNYTTVDESDESKIIDDNDTKKMVNMSTSKPDSQMNSEIQKSDVSSEIQKSDVSSELQSQDIKEISLSFFVYDQYKKGIEGIEYTVYDENLLAIGTFTSDASGQVTLGDLKVGKYYLVQTSTIDGYTLNDDVTSFSVTDKGIVEDLPNEFFLEAINSKRNWEIISIGKLVIPVVILIILIYIGKERKFYEIIND